MQQALAMDPLIDMLARGPEPLVARGAAIEVEIAAMSRTSVP